MLPRGCGSQRPQVAQQARRSGVARALMAAVARAAKAAGSTRIEWSTEPGNTAARAFYDGLGATEHHRYRYLVPPSGG